MNPAGSRKVASIPLAVDLDGSLLKSDSLYEGLVALINQHPAAIWKVVRALFTRGLAAMKAELNLSSQVDIATLPLREDFLTWLTLQAGAGRKLHLVSAADRNIVAKIASRVGIFTSWVGSDGETNLKGSRKADFLEAEFPGGFSYAGDSVADLTVWRRAETIVLVGASSSLTRKAAALHKPIEAQFPNQTNASKALLKQLRLHQWSKNVLVFVPILLAHIFLDRAAWLHSFLAVLGLSTVASATYVVNDLTDLTADRSHTTKRMRPIASGALSIVLACLVASLMLAAGFALAYAASPATALGSGLTS